LVGASRQGECCSLPEEERANGYYLESNNGTRTTPERGEFLRMSSSKKNDRVGVIARGGIKPGLPSGRGGPEVR